MSVLGRVWAFCWGGLSGLLGGAAASVSPNAIKSILSAFVLLWILVGGLMTFGFPRWFTGIELLVAELAGLVLLGYSLSLLARLTAIDGGAPLHEPSVQRSMGRTWGTETSPAAPEAVLRETTVQSASPPLPPQAVLLGETTLAGSLAEPSEETE